MGLSNAEEIKSNEENKKTAIMIYLTKEEAEVVDELSKKENRNRSNYVYNILKINVLDKNKINDLE